MTLIGIVLVMASGCVFNNFIDRDIDKLMERTKNRISAQGLVSGKFLVLYSLMLGVIGTLVLYTQTNKLTTEVALVGLFFYAGVYTLWYKRKSRLGAVIGSVSGAVPPVVGYCAVTNVFDSGAIILFLILCFWQLPHSYAIAIYRLSDYKIAKIPVLPVKKGILFTKVMMLYYIVIFTIVSAMLSVFSHAGLSYLIVAIALGVTWFILGIRGFKSTDEQAWARKMFLFSIIIIMLLSVLMSISN